MHPLQAEAVNYVIARGAILAALLCFAALLAWISGKPWLALAAQAGHPMAEYELGQLFEQGEVIPKNIETARVLYKAAVAGGVKEAADRLAALPPAPPPPPPPTP